MNCEARRAVLVEVWTLVTGQAETDALSNHGNCPEGVFGLAQPLLTALILADEYQTDERPEKGGAMPMG